MSKLYYSIHGSKKEGWSLLTYMPYRKVGDSDDSLTPNWLRAREYVTFEELMVDVRELMEQETGSNGEDNSNAQQTDYSGAADSSDDTPPASGAV